MDYIPANKRQDIPDVQKPPRHNGLNYREEGRLEVRQQDEWIWTRRLERYLPMAQSVFNGADYIPNNGRNLRVPGNLDSSWRPKNTILNGGALDAPMSPITAGVLGVIYRPETKHKPDQ